MEKLEFYPHPQIEGIGIAKRNGHSVIHGPFVRGYEIKFPDGHVESGFTLSEAESLTVKH